MIIFVFFNFLAFSPFPWKRQPSWKNQPLKAQIHMAYDITTRFHKVWSRHLRETCRTKIDVYKFLRHVFIPVAFNTLKEKSTTQQLLSVMNYIQGTWFDSTVWPVTAWSVFGKSVRTNNGVEGWHNRVNTHAQKSNLQFNPRFLCRLTAFMDLL
jgi:hypothetical protein